MDLMCTGLSPFPSPGSTRVPSPPPGRRAYLSGSEVNEADREYQVLSTGETSLDKEQLSWLKLAGKTLLAVAVLALLLVVVTIRPGTPVRLQIWQPDLRSEFRTEPVAKSVIRMFDAYNMARGGLDDGATFRVNVQQYLAPDLVYESVGFGTWRTPAGWARGEERNYGNAFPETIFTQMIFLGDDDVATTTTYGSAFWGGDLFGMKAPRQWVTLRITDFYALRRDFSGRARVHYNFMMIDWVDALRQVGRPMLPPAPLEEGLVLPPSANDGVPAPLTVLMQARGYDGQQSRGLAAAALEEDWAGNETNAGRWHEDMVFYGPGGIGLARGPEAYTQHVLGPWRKAFQSRSVQADFLVCEGTYCGALGRLTGFGVASWLGLPTKGRHVGLRFAMHWRRHGDRIKEGWAIFDMPGLFEQLGLDFYAMAAQGPQHA